MKLLIIPDVHGRDFWIEPCENSIFFDKIIFLGDYHDPYPHQVSVAESRQNLLKIKEFVDSHKDKVVCLLGNHDYSYLTGFAPCRYDGAYSEQYKEFLNSIDLKVGYRVGNYVFTHSGILPEWMDDYGYTTINDVLSLPITSPTLQSVSPNRGGWRETGSPIWGDLTEYNMNPHIEGVFQIFGHTQLVKDSPFIGKDFACLDCRKAFVLENDKLTEYYDWATGSVDGISLEN